MSKYINLIEKLYNSNIMILITSVGTEKNTKSLIWMKENT